MEKIKSWGDPDILQDLLTPEKMFKAEILIIAVQKETRFAHEYEPYLLQEAIQERALATLQ